MGAGIRGPITDLVLRPEFGVRLALGVRRVLGAGLGAGGTGAIDSVGGAEPELGAVAGAVGSSASNSASASGSNTGSLSDTPSSPVSLVTSWSGLVSGSSGSTGEAYAVMDRAIKRSVISINVIIFFNLFSSKFCR